MMLQNHLEQPISICYWVFTPERLKVCSRSLSKPWLCSLQV